ncbi:MAG: hypothetical protein KJO79_01395 [Verrucomicrobiae bacterium]|nr:hypothetical protein [Verrucomicrobiae bacterium]NNJ85802.1 hypothetical protein [Akkermansiaceae bacterium]
MDPSSSFNGGATGYKSNHENIQRSRLRVDTRKWMTSKMKPKKYGDKLELDADMPIDFVVTIGGSEE